MRKLLIVSPHFPPVNAPDVHRVRMSLPYYRDFGWDPHVLAVGPEQQAEPRDEGLLETLPADVPVTRVSAFPLRVFRKAGVGNVALRAWPYLYREGARLIREKKIDLAFFSTTMFFAMPMGRVWRQRLGVRYVIDLQDPWFSTYYEDKPESERPPKYALVQKLHERLERWTTRHVSGVMAVSAAYTSALIDRYAWVTPAMCDVIPFGAAERDLEVARRIAHGLPADAGGPPTGVYIGRGGADMATAARILFRGISDNTGSVSVVPDVTLRFIGTDYASDGRARKSIEPIASEEGLAHAVRETTDRQPFLHALAELLRADFLVLLGSDDPAYSASKVYPYIMARKPLLAIVHKRSPLVDVLRRTRAGTVVTFSGRDDVGGPAERLRRAWPAFSETFGNAPDVDWNAFEPFTARALTERQCRFFDRVAG